MAASNEDTDQKYFGFYRAKVIDNKDKEMFGRVKVYIPDVMPEIPDTKGLWALPGNNPIGGRNKEGDKSHFNMGTSYIPAIGSWTWVFFESGNINKPYYFGALDMKASKVLPEVQLGTNPSQKWVIFKSHDGRCIVISDDPKDARVEITGKKRMIAGPPSGDTASVYTIDGNQTTILFDERPGKEKILIRTYKGDFINIDITKSKLNASFKSDINISTMGNLFIKATGNIHVKASGGFNIQSGLNLNIKAGAILNTEAGGNLNAKAGGMVNHDGAAVNDMCGLAGKAESAISAVPIGERDT